MVLKRSLSDNIQKNCPSSLTEKMVLKTHPLTLQTDRSTFTYSAQSTAMISVMSSVGNPTEVSTITMVTSPACGIPAAPMLAAVAVMLKEHSYSFHNLGLEISKRRNLSLLNVFKSHWCHFPRTAVKKHLSHSLRGCLQTIFPKRSWQLSGGKKQTFSQGGEAFVGPGLHL